MRRGPARRNARELLRPSTGAILALLALCLTSARAAPDPGPASDEPVVFHTEPRVEVLRFSQDGSLLAAGDDSGWVYLWDLSGEKPVTSGFRASDWQVGDIVFSEDGAHVATIDGGGGALSVWSCENRELVKSHPGPGTGKFWIDAIARQPGSSTIAVASDHLYLFDLPELTKLRTVNLPDELKLQDGSAWSDLALRLLTLQFAGPDMILVGADNGAVYVGDLTQSPCSFTPIEAYPIREDLKHAVSGLAAATSGEFALAGSWGSETVRRLAFGEEAQVTDFVVAGVGLSRIRISDDASLALTVAAGKLGVWKMEDGTVAAELGGRVSSAAFHPTETWIARDTPVGVSVVDWTTGETAIPLRREGVITVRNSTQHAFKLFVRGPYSDTLQLPPGGSLRIGDVTPGKYLFSAVQQGGEGRHRFEAELGPAGIIIHYRKLW